MKKKLLCFLVATTCAFSTLLTTGCTPKDQPLAGELSIAIMEGGFGTEFLDKLIEGYKAKNPEVTIHEPEYFLGDAANDMIKSGPEDNFVDLFIAGPVFAGDLVEQGDTIYKGYDPILEDLTDVLESKAYGDDITIEEKLYDSVASSVRYTPNLTRFPEYAKYSGKAYTLPWAYGPGGLIFNKDFFDAHPEYKIPNTTDELIKLVQTIYDNHVVKDGLKDSEKVYPVIWAGENASAYWRYVTAVWIAQYDGLDAWERFLRTEDENGNFTDAVFNTEGRLKALEVLAPIIAEKNCYPNSIGTRHTDAQVQFMRGKAAMLPSGDWTENETLMSDSFGSEGADDIIMIKTPVLSALGTKLGITDEQLSAVVSAIDAGQTSVDGISASVFNEVKTARSIAVNCDFNHYIAVPAYSDAKEIAKDFIKYMYSNEGMKIFMQYARGTMPCEVTLTAEEYAELSPFRKSTYDIGRTATMIAMDYTKSPIMYRNNLQLFNLGGSLVENELGKKDNPATPADIFADSYEFVHNRWNTYKRVAGVK